MLLEDKNVAVQKCQQVELGSFWSNILQKQREIIWRFYLTSDENKLEKKKQLTFIKVANTFSLWGFHSIPCIGSFDFFWKRIAPLG
jgi:hypothetical protein